MGRKRAADRKVPMLNRLPRMGRRNRPRNPRPIRRDQGRQPQARAVLRPILRRRLDQASKGRARLSAGKRAMPARQFRDNNRPRPASRVQVNKAQRARAGTRRETGRVPIPPIRIAARRSNSSRPSPAKGRGVRRLRQVRRRPVRNNRHRPDRQPSKDRRERLGPSPATIRAELPRDRAITTRSPLSRVADQGLSPVRKGDKAPNRSPRAREIRAVAAISPAAVADKTSRTQEDCRKLTTRSRHLRSRPRPRMPRRRSLPTCRSRTSSSARSRTCSGRRATPRSSKRPPGCPAISWSSSSGN